MEECAPDLQKITVYICASAAAFSISLFFAMNEHRSCLGSTNADRPASCRQLTAAAASQRNARGLRTSRPFRLAVSAASAQERQLIAEHGCRHDHCHYLVVCVKQHDAGRMVRLVRYGLVNVHDLTPQDEVSGARGPCAHALPGGVSLKRSLIASFSRSKDLRHCDMAASASARVRGLGASR
jgi:hypothetical protein